MKTIYLLQVTTTMHAMFNQTDISDHQEPDYHDRRTRRNRGNRYAEVLLNLNNT